MPGEEGGEERRRQREELWYACAGIPSPLLHTALTHLHTHRGSSPMGVWLRVVVVCVQVGKISDTLRAMLDQTRAAAA